MKEYLKNGWNWVHLLGSCVLTVTLAKLMQPIYAGILIWSLGFLWECLDECQKHLLWNLWFFDPDGFDIRDWLIMDLAGIVLALILGGIYAG